MIDEIIAWLLKNAFLVLIITKTLFLENPIKYMIFRQYRAQKVKR